MINIGKFNRLRINRIVDFGLYLSDEGGNEVLLPNKYINFDFSIGDETEVFVYNDSEGRPVATTLKPYAQVGEFAFMRVAQVNSTGAFLEWGVEKDILVPFREQKTRMEEGHIYPVYIYLDDASGRVVASSKLGKYLGNVFPDYRYGASVSVLVYEEIPIGYKVIVDNLHQGILYKNKLYRPVRIGDKLRAFVHQIRPDGKIDLSLEPGKISRTKSVSEKILEYLEVNGNENPVGDSSSPDLIREEFQCSKKDFKRAIGSLYKEHKIVIYDGTIQLAEK